MERIRHGHLVYEDRRGVVLCDDSGEEAVVDRSRPIRMGWLPRGGSYADVPLDGGGTATETAGGALFLAARFHLRIETEDGVFFVGKATP